MKKRTRLFLVSIVALHLVFLGLWLFLWRASQIAFVGYSGSTLKMLTRASENTAVKIRLLTRDGILREKLTRFKVLFVQVHGTPLSEEMVKRLEAAKARGVTVVATGGRREAPDPLSSPNVKEQNPDLLEYWRNGGLENYQRFLRYGSVRVCRARGAVEAPNKTPEDGLYHPEAPGVFTEVAAYLSWYKKTPHYRPGAPLIAIDPATGWRDGETAVTDELVRQFEAKGANVLPIFGHHQKAQILLEAKPDLIVNHLTMPPRWMFGNAPEFLKQMDIPLITTVSLGIGGRLSREQWLLDPRGMGSMGTAISLAFPELDGAIEPLVIDSWETDADGFNYRAPMPDRVARLVERALGWAKLRRTPSQEKRVAVLYFKSAKGHVGGGGLNVPSSLVAFLRRMKAAGYDLSTPTDEKTLLDWMDEAGRNIHSWAPGELEKLAASSRVTLLDVAQYRQWLREELSETNLKKVLSTHGEPPGATMCVRKEGREFFVIPKIPLGKVLLLPQPGRGGDETNETIYGTEAPRPPHQYLAVYLWLKRAFDAPAVIHYGTHGNLEFLPGKQAGLTNDDWSDLLIGDMPNVYVYIMDDVGEALTAKRRSYAAIVSHLTPPIVTAGIYGDLRSLQNLIHDLEDLEEGPLKAEYRKQVAEKVKALRLDLDLDMKLSGPALTDEQIKNVDKHLHRLASEKIPKGLHIHGQPPDLKEMLPILVEMLGESFIGQFAKFAAESAPDKETQLEEAKRKAETFLAAVLFEGLSPDLALTQLKERSAQPSE